MSSPGPADQGDYQALNQIGQKAVRKRTWLIRLLGLTLLVGGAIATVFTLGRKDTMGNVLVWIHAHPAGGFFIFVLIYCWFTGMIALMCCTDAITIIKKHPELFHGQQTYVKEAVHLAGWFVIISCDQGKQLCSLTSSSWGAGLQWI
jgi:hypothetical protein